MLSVISWGMMAMSSRVDKELMLIQLLVARFMIGIVIGLSSAPSAVYSAEIAHPTLRGRFSVITSVTIALGVLVIYVLGYLIPVRFWSSSFRNSTCFCRFIHWNPFSTPLNQDNWRMVSGISCAISLASLILLIPIPETPTWLASKGRTEKAEKSLRIFKGLPSKGIPTRKFVFVSNLFRERYPNWETNRKFNLFAEIFQVVSSTPSCKVKLIS